MKPSIKVIILFFLLPASSFAEIEHITSICDEPSFLECTHKNKQECINSFTLSISYCEKIHPYNFNETHDYTEEMSSFIKCTIKSTQAYYDDKNKLEQCMSKTKYSKNLLQRTEKELKK